VVGTGRGRAKPIARQGWAVSFNKILCEGPRRAGCGRRAAFAGGALRIESLSFGRADGPIMTQELKQAGRSWWLPRVLVRGVAWLCGGTAIGCMILFVSVLALPTRSLLLLPVALIFLPVALAAAILGCPLWGIGAACGLWLQDREGVYGKIESEGIRLDALHSVGPDFIAWAALEKVVRVRYPLSILYQLELRDGSAARVDFLDEEQMVPQLKEHGVGFRRCDWTGKEAL